MRESPAKSASSANDINPYSYCPISHVYHALFRAHKTRIAPLSGKKLVATSLSPRSFAPVRTTHASTQICVPLALSNHRCLKSLSIKFGGRRLANPNRADVFVEVAHFSIQGVQRHTPPKHAQTSERGLHES